MPRMLKTERMRKAYSAGDYKTALWLAKGFRIGVSNEDRHAMSLAYECLVRPRFYREVGCDVNAAVRCGIDTLERKLCSG